MKDQRKLEIKVGVTVIIALLILLGGFAVFKEWALFASQKQITMRFPTSAGLQAGDNVSLNGVDIGKVSSVAFDRDGIIVSAMIASDTEIREGALPVIMMLELMGGKKVEITQGAGPGLMNGNVVMDGRVDPDIPGALHLVGEMEGNIRALGENANELMQNINTVIGDDEVLDALKGAIVNLRALAVETRAMVSENRANVREIAGTMNTVTKNLDTLLTQLEPRLNGTLDKGDKTLAGADSLITELRSVVRDIKQGDGMVSRALYDDGLSQRFDNIMSRVDSVLGIIIDENLKIRIRL